MVFARGNRARMRPYRRSDKQRNRLLSIVGIGVSLIVAALVFVSYDATNGVPFSNEYQLNVELPSVRRLGKNAEVRVAGLRVGRVQAVDAAPNSDRAVVSLALAPNLRGLAACTQLKVRPISVLGASYVELFPCRDGQPIGDGGIIFPSQYKAAPGITDLLQIFTPKLRADVSRVAIELGDAFAGQGDSLQEALDRLPTLLADVEVVTRVINSRPNQVNAILSNLERISFSLAEVGPELGGLLKGSATTVAGLNSQREAVRSSIEQFPAAAASGQKYLLELRPVAENLKQTAINLRSATVNLNVTLPAVAELSGKSVGAVESLAQISQRAVPTLDQVNMVASDPSLDGSIRKTFEASKSSVTLGSALTPAQKYCNVFALYAQSYSLLGGFAKGAPPVFNQVINGSGAAGEGFASSKPASNLGFNPIPNANSKECEAGNEQWDGVNQHLGNPAGLQPRIATPTRPAAGAYERAKDAGLIDLPKGFDAK